MLGGSAADRRDSLRAPCRAVVIAAVLLPVWVSAAGAQGTPEKPKYGSFRFGPLYLSLRLQLTAGFESNVYNTPTPVGDDTVTLVPSLQAVLPVTRRARIRATGGILPSYFHREASERHTDLLGNVLGEVDVGPLTAFGGFGGGRYRQRFSLEIDERLLRHESNNTFGGALRLGQRVTVTGSQIATTYTFDPAAEVDGVSVSLSLDRKTVTRRLEVRLPLTRKTSLSPWVDVVEDRFLQSSPGFPTTVKSQRYAVALDFGELAFVNGRIAAGVRHFGSVDGVTPYDGLFLSISASMPFIADSRLTLSSNRDVAYSATPGPQGVSIRNTFVQSVYRGEVACGLPWKLYARPFVGYAEADYLAAAGPADTVPERKDHTWIFGAALLRRLGSHASLGVTAQKEHRRSPVPGREYHGTLYGLTGEVTF